jgi:hypothetical protein
MDLTTLKLTVENGVVRRPSGVVRTRSRKGAVMSLPGPDGDLALADSRSRYSWSEFAGVILRTAVALAEESDEGRLPRHRR